MNKTLKKTLKGLKPPKVPDRVKLLSLLAIVLVVGAPALVSIIDDNHNVAIESPVDGLVPLDVGNFVYLGFTVLPDEPEDKAISLIHESGSYVVAMDKPTFASDVRYYAFEGFSKPALKSVSKIVLTFDTDKVDSIRFHYGNTWKIFTNVVDTDGNPTTTWIFEPTSIDKARMQSDAFIGIRVLFAAGEAPAALSMDYTTYGTTSIPYGEIIVGLSGIVLMLCALFATPRFGVFKKKGVKS